VNFWLYVRVVIIFHILIFFKLLNFSHIRFEMVVILSYIFLSFHSVVRREASRSLYEKEDTVRQISLYFITTCMF